MKSIKVAFFILVFAVFFYLSACSPSDKGSYEEAKRKNSIAAYENFIINYPESNLVEDAKINLATRYMRKFVSENEKRGESSSLENIAMDGCRQDCDGAAKYRYWHDYNIYKTSIEAETSGAVYKTDPDTFYICVHVFTAAHCKGVEHYGEEYKGIGFAHENYNYKLSFKGNNPKPILVNRDSDFGLNEMCPDNDRKNCLITVYPHGSSY